MVKEATTRMIHQSELTDACVFTVFTQVTVTWFTATTEKKKTQGDCAM